MKVLHSVYSWLTQTRTWIYTQVSYLPPEVESSVVCDVAENLDQFPAPRLHALSEGIWGRWLSRLPQPLRRPLHHRLLLRAAREAGARVLHSHFGDQGWADVPAARQAGLKHAVTFYGYDATLLPHRKRRWRRRYRRLFAAVDHVLCEGPFMARTVGALGCPEEKVTVLHLGVRLADIPFAPRRWRPGEPLRVLIAASFVEKKGIPYGLAALARLQRQTGVDLEITLIGDAKPEGRSRAEKARIEAAVSEAGLGDRVRRLGFQPHAKLLEEARRHQLFLAPSVTAADGDAEGGAPVSLIEMSASGMAIVSSRHCDIPEVVRHGETGLLAGERDVEELAARLRWWVEHPQRWDAMLAAGRRHVEAEFDARRQAERLAEVYVDMVAGGAVRGD